MPLLLLLPCGRRALNKLLDTAALVNATGSPVSLDPNPRSSSSTNPPVGVAVADIEGERGSRVAARWGDDRPTRFEGEFDGHSESPDSIIIPSSSLDVFTNQGIGVSKFDAVTGSRDDEREEEEEEVEDRRVGVLLALVE